MAGVARVTQDVTEPLECAEVSFTIVKRQTPKAQKDDPDNVIAWMKPVIDGLRDARILADDGDGQVYYTHPVQVFDKKKSEVVIQVMARKKPDERYKNMVAEVENKFCWACGVQPQPYGYERYAKIWHNAPFMIERAHIVGGAGRIEKRECVNLLCSLCHNLNHREVFRLEDNTTLPFLDRCHMVWIKQLFDPEWFNRELLDQCCVGICPDPEEPPQWFLNSLQLRGRI